MARSRRVPLSRERILDTAEALVAAEGLGALSMRRIAAELDTGAMSLYNHIPNKEALLTGLAERVVAQVQMPAGAGRRDLAASWARSVRRTLVANRQILPLVFSLPRRELMTGLARALTDALTRRGLTGGEAREVASVLGRYVAGTLVFDGANPNRADAERDRLDRIFERGVTALLDGLPALRGGPPGEAPPGDAPAASARPPGDGPAGARDVAGPAPGAAPVFDTCTPADGSAGAPRASEDCPAVGARAVDARASGDGPAVGARAPAEAPAVDAGGPADGSDVAAATDGPARTAPASPTTSD